WWTRRRARFSTMKRTATSDSGRTARELLMGVHRLIFSKRFGLCRDVDAAPADHVRRRLQQKLNVEQHRALLDVLHIQLFALLPRDGIAAVELSETRNARLDVQAPLLGGSIKAELIREFRPRTDQAQITREHVDQLGQLIQAWLAQKSPHRGQPRIPVAVESGAVRVA